MTFDEKVQQVRAVVREFMRAKLEERADTATLATQEGRKAATAHAAEWLDAAIAGLGLELGDAFNIARLAYGLKAEGVIESVQANVLNACGIVAVSVRVHSPASTPTRPN